MRRIGLFVVSGGVALAAAAATVRTGSAPSPEPVAHVPRVPRVAVEAVETRAPAHAAVAWFVPMLAGNEGFERLVARALGEGLDTRLAGRATETRAELVSIRRQLADAGLPDVMIGIPYQESRLRASATSPQCAGGVWQFLPEVAVAEGLRVERCWLYGASEPWSPGRIVPNRVDRFYAGPDACRIASCEVDERRDLGRSTRAAIRHLRGLVDDERLSGHPHGIPLAVLAYNNGLWGTERALDQTDGALFDVVHECATGDCLVLGREQAWYVPKVVATAAIVACNAPTGERGGLPIEPSLSDWARSDLCRTMHEAGLAPPPLSSERALSAVATLRGGLSVGLATLDVDGFGHLEERRVLDGVLLAALSDIDGLRAIPGVPGETPEALFAQGADVVLAGEVGRRGDRLWLRLERHEPDGTTSPGAFVLLGDEGLPDEEAVELLADALLHPRRDRQADAIRALVEARGDVLATCLPAVVDGYAEPEATVKLRVGRDGRAAALEVGPGTLPAEATACLEGELAAFVFPAELAGAGADLLVRVVAPAVADAESGP